MLAVGASAPRAGPRTAGPRRIRGRAAPGAADRAALTWRTGWWPTRRAPPAVEVVFGGLAVRASAPADRRAGRRGGPGDVDGMPVGHHSVVDLRPGQVLRLGDAADRPAHLPRGPRRDRRRAGPRVAEHGHAVRARAATRWRWARCCRSARSRRAARSSTSRRCPRHRATRSTVHAVLGPRAEYVAEPERADRDRVDGVEPAATGSACGWRAGGCAAGRRRRELPSEGMVRGAIQVPPGGEPVVFLADHPVTGGYPVVATVCDADVDRLAASPPRAGCPICLVHSVAAVIGGRLVTPRC